MRDLQIQKGVKGVEENEGWWARSSSAVAWRATGCHSGGNWSELRKDGGREEAL